MFHVTSNVTNLFLYSAATGDVNRKYTARSRTKVWKGVLGGKRKALMENFNGQHKKSLAFVFSEEYILAGSGT
jgi:hypothetical protein